MSPDAPDYAQELAYQRAVRGGLIQAALLLYLRVARAGAVDAAAALWTVRQLLRRVGEAPAGPARERAVEALLEAWPRADARLRWVIASLLDGREARVCARVLAGEVDAAEEMVEAELARRHRKVDAPLVDSACALRERAHGAFMSD